VEENQRASEMKTRLILFFSASLLFTCCSPSPEESTTDYKGTTTSVQTIYYDYTNSYPHDINSFTEGFLFHDGKLYESTGATPDLPQTRSLFGVVDLTTGKIDTKAELDKTKYFGEGITFLNGKVYQLTYKTKIGFVYDAVTFKRIKQFTFPSEEGWGMTTDGKNLIMSDGTNTLTFLDPQNLTVVKTIQVSENGYAVDYLNELEYIKGFIYANLYGTNKIARIEPDNGRVTGMLDLTSLAHEAKTLYRGSLEMNGIAYDEAEDKILITGKMWPKIYEIKLRN
jgi:glutamine cyclotransferase